MTYVPSTPFKWFTVTEYNFKHLQSNNTLPQLFCTIIHYVAVLDQPVPNSTTQVFFSVHVWQIMNIAVR